MLNIYLPTVTRQPMVAYTLATKQPAMCLVANTRGNTPVDAAVACEQGEVSMQRSPAALRADAWSEMQDM